MQINNKNKFSFGLILLIFYLNLNLISECNALKILGIVPTGIKSHYHIGSAIMKGLTDRGHEVTVISPFTNPNPPKNWRDLKLYNFDKLMGNTNFAQSQHSSIFEVFSDILHLGILLTNTTYHERNVQKLLQSKNETFDLIILEVFVNEAMLGFGYHFNAPIIGYSTFGASSWTCDMVGTPSPPSYVPLTFLSFTDHMTFIERFINMIMIILDRLFIDFIYFPRQEKLYEEIFKNDQNKPKLIDLQKNVSLVLVNNHFSVNYPRPYLPNMIEVGGLQINRKNNPLPNDIKNILDSSNNGVIYFSMGSHLKSAELPNEKLNIFLNVFKSLNNLTILWKWENETLPGKSKNIFIKNWFPQSDILAHPNIKLFITHGGLLSTTEAIYHGVPVIGIPMFADQFLNMARAVKSGFGIKVNFDDINEYKLKTAINEILYNPKYKNIMNNISKYYRDQPMTPLETAIYWIEYVARHNGASHLRSAGQDLSFIAYHSLDVLATIFACLVLILYLIFFIIRTIFRKLFSNSKITKKKFE